MRRISTLLNEWGEPVFESKPAAKKVSLDEEILRKHQIQETLILEEAEARLNAVYFKMNRIHARLLDERVSVDLVNAEQSGEAKFEIKVHAGNLSSVVEELRKEAFNEADNDEDFYSIFEDRLSEVFGAEVFRKKLEDLLWESIRKTGEFSGIQIEVTEYPRKESEFKDAKFLIEMSLSFEDPEVDQQAVERAISDAITSAI